MEISVKELNELLEKEFQRGKNDYTINIPYVQTIGTYEYIPNACKNCPNNPSNGGSGICNCVNGIQSTTYTNVNNV